MAAMRDGIDHLGTLMRNIREAHHLTQKQVRSVRGLDKSIVAKFEATGQISVRSFQHYVEGLGLEEDERQVLLTKFLLHSRDSRDIHYHEKRLGELRFAALQHPPNAQKEAYRRVLAALQKEGNPAYIRDELWFVHAYNQPLLDLLDITHADLLKSQMDRANGWVAWHVIGSKYAPGSKLVAIHGNFAELYFPRALKQFFEETAHIFFTAQMKALRNRLWLLSETYQRWWRGISALNIPYGPDPDLQRDILYQGKSISMSLSSDEKFTVRLPQGPVTYTKIVWSPIDTDAEEVIAKITSAPSPELIFAATFIPDYNHGSELS